MILSRRLTRFGIVAAVAAIMLTLSMAVAGTANAQTPPAVFYGKNQTAGNKIEAFIGGKFRIVMAHGQGDADHWGEYLAIEPPSLLSFTWISAHTELQPSVVTIELQERDNGTELTLTHRRLPAGKVEAHRKGWTDIVRKLGEALQS